MVFSICLVVRIDRRPKDPELVFPRYLCCRPGPWQSEYVVRQQRSCLLIMPPGHSKLGQDVRLHRGHSFGDRVQFPAFRTHRHSSVVVLLSSDCVSYPIHLYPHLISVILLGTTCRPRANSSVSTPSPSHRSLLGSPSLCLDCRRSGPTTNK